MRTCELFGGLRCFVSPEGLAPAQLLALECALRDGGAALLDERESAGATHVVCAPEAFAAFSARRSERFVWIVRPEWVLRSFLLQHLLPADRFSADPALFFSGLAIAAGPIDKDQRRVIDGIIAHFGGQIIDQGDMYAGATHILSPEDTVVPADAQPERINMLNLSFSDADVARAAESWRQALASQTNNNPAFFELPSCLVAFLGKQAGLAEQFYINYTWIEECARHKSRVPEGPFALPGAVAARSNPISWKSRPVLDLEDLNLHKCIVVYQLARTDLNLELSMLRKASEKLPDMESSLSGAIVLLAQHIPPTLCDKMMGLLRAANAKVANVPLGDAYQDIVRKVVANASFVVCRYRAGFEYEEAMRQKKRVVSVFWVLNGGHKSGDQSKFDEAIERPALTHGIPGMQSLVITLSGFTSRTRPSRDQVQIAISSTGACMLPVLSRTHSTHLLCYEPAGEKFKKAKSWRFENILSHEWLFDCIAAWKYLPEEKYLYCSHKPLSKPSASDTGKPAIETTTNSKTNQSTDDGESNCSNTAKTPASARKRGANGGRFDVDDLLTELDHTTPQDKKAPSATVIKDTDASKDATKVPSEVACQLFDTPTMSARKPRRKAGSNSEDTEPEPELAADPPKTNAAKKAKASRAASGIKKDSAKDESSNVDSRKTDEGAPENDDVPKPTIKNLGPPKTSKVATSTTSRKRKSSSLSSATSEMEPETGGSEKSGPKKKTTKRTLGATVSSNAPGSDFVFLLTGTREEVAVNESIILGLGGKVSNVGRRYDGKATHIICSELKRTEKFVAGCAAGKWILKPSYLEESSKAGKFVAEDSHEWGSKPEDKGFMDDRIWSCAPSFWRTARAAGKPGAFLGWRVLVHSKCVPPADMCERIVVAGDGTVVPMTKATDLTKLAAEAADDKPVVALVPTDLPARDAWLKKLKASNVECINASFLIDFLTKEQAPPVSRAQYHV